MAVRMQVLLATFYACALLSMAVLYLIHGYIIVGKIPNVKIRVHNMNRYIDSGASQVMETLKTIGIISGYEVEGGQEDSPVDCDLLFRGEDSAIIQAKQVSSHTRIADSYFPEMTRDCGAYRKQRGFMEAPVNQEEAQYPLAFIIQMYRGVHQVERLLKAVYRPQNVYCINVDASSNPGVQDGMTSLARCFPNVILTHVDVAWSKWSQVEADLVCMTELLTGRYRWNYVLSLTGQEFPLKTNLDIVRILKSLNGSNMVEALTRRRNLERWHHLPPPPVNVTLVKGQCHWAFTRSFVDYVLHDHRALAFRKWANRTSFPDEHFFQSLSHSPQLGVPGAYTGVAEQDVAGYYSIVRHKVWADHSWARCEGVFVSAVCVFGVGDLRYMNNSVVDLFANKFYDFFQPLTLLCLESRHQQWTEQDRRADGTSRINITFYQSLPNVIQHIPSGLEI